MERRLQLKKTSARKLSSSEVEAKLWKISSVVLEENTIGLKATLEPYSWRTLQVSFPVEISSDTSHRLPGSAIASERPSQKRFGNSRERVTEVSDGRARDSRARCVVSSLMKVSSPLSQTHRGSRPARTRITCIECSPEFEVDTFGFLDRLRLVIVRIEWPRTHDRTNLIPTLWPIWINFLIY